MVSVPGKRAIPSMAWSALSERNQSGWANRLAPLIPGNKNASSVCAGGTALGLRNSKGIAFCTSSASPTLRKNSIRLTRPQTG